MKPTKPPLPSRQDLGFGDRVVRESRQRLLHRNGTFNVRREGLGFFESWTAYEYLITTTWPRFLFLVGVAYAVTNAVFAFAFWAAGPAAIAGPEEPFHGMGRYLKDYFFSVQTLATIGYGHLSPSGLLPNVIVALESLVGLLGIALITGLAFARFARPAVGIRFSDRAVIAPYLDGRGFMFRVVNTHQSELVNAQARIILARRKSGQEGSERELIPIALERETIVFFPLSWTIVHPITEESPLSGATERMLREWDAEFLIMLSALDETSYQIVHARSSYRADEIVFGAKFRSMLGQKEDGTFSVDVRSLSAVEHVELGDGAKIEVPAGSDPETRARP